MKIPIEQVKVREDRFRTDLGDMESLQKSISQYGLIHPIVVTRDHEVVAGERRFRACQALGLKEVEVVYRDETDELTKREIELEENVVRQSMSDEEVTMAVLEIHRLKQKKYGESRRGVSGGWTLQDTADALNISKGHASMLVQVGEHIERSPLDDVHQTLQKGGVMEAYKTLTRQRVDQVMQVLSQKKTKEAAKTISEAGAIQYVDGVLFNVDCVEGISRIPEGSIDAIVTDPPYGIDLARFKDVAVHGVYSDSEEELLAIWKILPAELSRVLKDDAFVFIWTGFTHYGAILELMESAGFVGGRPPFVGVRMSGRYHSNHPEQRLASACDFGMLLVKGNPRLVKLGQPNFLLYPEVPPQQKIHPVEKPVALLSHILSIIAVSGSTILDPFAGSASTLVAAAQLGMKGIGFEVDPIYYSKARMRYIEVVQSLQEVPDAQGS
jgi:16S rRNA G966 N2-methylase RsmD